MYNIAPSLPLSRYVKPVKNTQHPSDTNLNSQALPRNDPGRVHFVDTLRPVNCEGSSWPNKMNQITSQNSISRVITSITLVLEEDQEEM